MVVGGFRSFHVLVLTGKPFVIRSLSVRHPFERLKKSVQSVRQTVRTVCISVRNTLASARSIATSVRTVVTSVRTVSTSVRTVFASVRQLEVSVRRTAASVRMVWLPFCSSVGKEKIALVGQSNSCNTEQDDSLSKMTELDVVNSDEIVLKVKKFMRETCGCALKTKCRVSKLWAVRANLLHYHFFYCEVNITQHRFTPPLEWKS